MSESFWFAGVPYVEVSGSTVGSGEEKYWWQGRPKSGLPEEAVSGDLPVTTYGAWWQGMEFRGLNVGQQTGTDAYWWMALPSLAILSSYALDVLAGSGDYVFEG